jgi:hypothetical protein
MQHVALTASGDIVAQNRVGVATKCRRMWDLVVAPSWSQRVEGPNVALEAPGGRSATRVAARRATWVFREGSHSRGGRNRTNPRGHIEQGGRAGWHTRPLHREPPTECILGGAVDEAAGDDAVLEGPRPRDDGQHVLSSVAVASAVARHRPRRSRWPTAPRAGYWATLTARRRSAVRRIVPGAKRPSFRRRISSWRFWRFRKTAGRGFVVESLVAQGMRDSLPGAAPAFTGTTAAGGSGFCVGTVAAAGFVQTSRPASPSSSGFALWLGVSFAHTQSN